jgi:hypothetical protein
VGEAGCCGWRELAAQPSRGSSTLAKSRLSARRGLRRTSLASVVVFVGLPVVPASHGAFGPTHLSEATAFPSPHRCELSGAEGEATSLPLRLVVRLYAQPPACVVKKRRSQKALMLRMRCVRLLLRSEKNLR